jgi:protein-disulfide isomerase
MPTHQGDVIACFIYISDIVEVAVLEFEDGICGYCNEA